MWDLIERVVIGVLLIWVCLSGYQMIIFEEHVYDCSNMVADQEQFFNGLGIDTKIGFRKPTENSYGHVWLIFHDIPFESTDLMLGFDVWNYIPEQTFDNTSELVKYYPEYKNEFT